MIVTMQAMLLRTQASFPTTSLSAGVLSRSVRPSLGRLSSRQLQNPIRLAAVQKKGPTEDVVDENIGDFCNLDKQAKKPPSKKTLGELEAEFLDALRAFYYDGKPSMSNEEFDNLKEELIWQGSKVAVLSSDEQRFMEASLAYGAGKPFLSDKEFDDLKKRLKKSGSFVTAQGPRCSLRSQKLYSDATVDYVKMTLLNLPAALLVLLALFSVDDLTGFEITKIMELPQPYGIIVVWGIVLPSIFVLASSITNLVFKDAVILKGPCPNCGAENQTYFGDILTVAGSRDGNKLDCPSCKAKLEFLADRRQIVTDANQPEAVKKQTVKA